MAAETVWQRARRDWHSWRQRWLATLVFSLAVAVLYFLASLIWGSSTAAHDALVAVILAAVLLVAFPLAALLVLAGTAPHRILSDRLVLLEGRPIPELAPSAPVAERVPKRTRRKVPDINYQAEQLMQIVQESSHWGISSLDHQQLDDALAGGVTRKNRVEAHEPLTADNVRIGIDALVAKAVWSVEFIPDGGVFYCWDPAKHWPPPDQTPEDKVLHPPVQGAGKPLLAPRAYQMDAVRQVLPTIKLTMPEIGVFALQDVLKSHPRTGSNPVYEPLYIETDTMEALVESGELRKPEPWRGEYEIV
jgi:hypothetical protein